MESKRTSEIIKDWVELYSDNLYSWALYKTSSKETAEDLVQETFLAAVQSFDKFEAKSNPKTWLFAILNNKIGDFFRTSFRSPIEDNQGILDRMFDKDSHWRADEKPQEWTNDAENLLDNSEFLITLNDCMHRLPENWRVAIHLKFLEEKKGELICQELQITPTNFWQILHRSKLQLRKCLEMNWFNE